MGPDANSVYPKEGLKQVVYIKNVITRPNILVGDYTYYDDADGAEDFERHVTHHYEFIGDRLIIGANSVVASDIPPYSVAAGNPCRVVRRRFDDELTGLLLWLKWWDKPIDEIDALIPVLTSSDLEYVKRTVAELLG